MTPILAFVLAEARVEEQIIRTQKSEHESKIIYRHVTMHHTTTSTVRSIVSKMQTLLRNLAPLNLAKIGAYRTVRPPLVLCMQ